MKKLYWRSKGFSFFSQSNTAKQKPREQVFVWVETRVRNCEIQREINELNWSNTQSHSRYLCLLPSLVLGDSTEPPPSPPTLTNLYVLTCTHILSYKYMKCLFPSTILLLFCLTILWPSSSSSCWSSRHVEQSDSLQYVQIFTLSPRQFFFHLLSFDNFFFYCVESAPKSVQIYNHFN